MKRNLPTIIFLTVLFGCATPTKYEPAKKKGGAGYREAKIEENRYRVSFKGNESTSRETVEHYLLYRAAELTQDNGYKYFLITERSTEAQIEYESVVPVYGYYPFRYRHCRLHRDAFCSGRFPYYAYGYPWGYGAPVRTDHRYEAVAYLTMHKEKPSGDEHNIYEAEEVLRSLRPLIERKD